MSQFIEMFGKANMRKLDNYIQVIRGVSYKPSDVKTATDTNTVIILRSNNINDANLNTDEIVYINKDRVSEEQYIRINDIVVCASNGSKALVGKAAINKHLKDKYAHGAFCLLVRPNEGINPMYLSMFFQTSLYKKQIDELAAGSNILNIKQEHLTNLVLPLPSMEEQDKFAKIVKQADKSKFGDFKSQFIEMFGTVESYCKLEDLVSDTFPGEWGSEPTSENVIKVIRTTNFTNEGHLDLADVVTRDIEPKKVARKKLKQGDTILERSGGTKDNPVGRVVFFDEIGDYLLNNFTQALRPKESVNPVYLFYALYNSYNINKAAMRAMASQTTGIQNLSMSDFMSKSIVLPSRDEQNKFEQIYRQADKSKSVIQKALVYLNDIQSDELGKIA